MRSFVALVVLLVGCASSPPDAAETNRAVGIIWNELLQAPGAPPAVAWASMRKCLDVVQDECTDGFYDGQVAIVGWKGAIPPSALAHELLHAWLLRTRGDGDAGHAGDAWYREERINRVLEWRGY